MRWGWGEIMDVTAQGAETTYNLEVERKRDGVRSRMTAQGAETTNFLEVERKQDGVRSRMQLHWEQRR